MVEGRGGDGGDNAVCLLCSLKRSSRRSELLLSALMIVTLGKEGGGRCAQLGAAVAGGGPVSRRCRCRPCQPFRPRRFVITPETNFAKAARCTLRGWRAGAVRARRGQSGRRSSATPRLAVGRNARPAGAGPDKG